MSDPIPTEPSVPPRPTVSKAESLLLRLRRYIREHSVFFMLAGLIFTFLVVFLANRIFILIGPGEAGVLFRRLQDGTHLEKPYHEGMRVIWPWNKMFIYNVRVQEHSEVVHALSSNGLTIDVTLSMRYYPDYPNLPLLHQKVGPDYATKVVVPEVVAGVREVIGKYRPDDLYTLKTSDISRAIIQSVVRSVAEKFIVLDDINIKDIRLPPQVRQAIENKLTQEQMAKEYEFRLRREELEAERLATKASGLAVYHSRINSTLTPELLRYKGIEATLSLAQSQNAKIVVVGGGEQGLPLILNTETGAPSVVPEPTFSNPPANNSNLDATQSTPGPTVTPGPSLTPGPTDRQTPGSVSPPTPSNGG